jgi:hypothetical protein
MRKWLGSAIVCVPLLSASVMASAAQTSDGKREASTLPIASLSPTGFGAGLATAGDLSTGNFSFNAAASSQDGRLRVVRSSIAPELQQPLSPVGRLSGSHLGANRFSSADALSVTSPHGLAGDLAHASLTAAHLSVSYGGDVSDGHQRDAEGNDSFSVLQARQDGSAQSPEVNAYAYEVSAVSEPSSFALAAAGLAIIGFVAAKRRRS